MKYEGLCELQQLSSIQLAGENYKLNKCKRFISLMVPNIKDDLWQDFNIACFVTIMSDG